MEFLSNIGVETPEQLAFLQEKNCDLYPGYIKSPPLPAEALVELLQGFKLAVQANKPVERCLHGQIFAPRQHLTCAIHRLH